MTKFDSCLQALNTQGELDLQNGVRDRVGILNCVHSEAVSRPDATFGDEMLQMQSLGLEAIATRLEAIATNSQPFKVCSSHLERALRCHCCLGERNKRFSREHESMWKPRGKMVREDIDT